MLKKFKNKYTYVLIIEEDSKRNGNTINVLEIIYTIGE